MGTDTDNDDSLLSPELEKQKKEMLKHLELRECKSKTCARTFKVNKEHEQEHCSYVCETGIHEAMFIPEIFTVSGKEKRRLNKNVTNYGAANMEL